MKSRPSEAECPGDKDSHNPKYDKKSLHLLYSLWRREGMSTEMWPHMCHFFILLKTDAFVTLVEWKPKYLEQKLFHNKFHTDCLGTETGRQWWEAGDSMFSGLFPCSNNALSHVFSRSCYKETSYRPVNLLRWHWLSLMSSSLKTQVGFTRQLYCLSTGFKIK